MQGSLAGLLQESASVYRLVEFIERFCIEQQSSRSYVFATDQFLNIVIELAEGTRKYLADIAQEAYRRVSAGKSSSFLDTWINNERSALHTIKGSWTIIHRYAGAIGPCFAEAHGVRHHSIAS